MQLRTWDRKHVFDMGSLLSGGIDLKNIFSTPITESNCKNSRCSLYASTCSYYLQNQCLKIYIDKGVK